MSLVWAHPQSKFALKSIAVRHQNLTAESARLDVELARLVAGTAPALVAFKGMGTQIAAADQLSSVPLKICQLDRLVPSRPLIRSCIWVQQRFAERQQAVSFDVTLQVQRGVAVAGGHEPKRQSL